MNEHSARFSNVTRTVFNATCDRIQKISKFSMPGSGLTISYSGTQTSGEVLIEGNVNCSAEDFKNALGIFIEEYNR